MAVKEVCAILIFLPALVYSASRGDACTTPNREAATCTAVRQCQVIKDAIATRRKSALDFAKKSQCGYDSDPLVCCGSLGDFGSVPSNPPTAPGGSLSPLLPNRRTCGFEKTNRIFGGELTEIWEHPWTALLRYRFTDGRDAGFQCGGTLINNRYVLTAAHCVIINKNRGFELNSIRLGEWKISTNEDCEEALAIPECADPVEDVDIVDKIVFPQYEIRSGRNDIALLRLSRRIAYTVYIKPICMPIPNAQEPPPGLELVAVGWGATENSSESDVKLKVKVPIVSQATCQAKMKNTRRTVTENQICAGGVSGKDSCTGDSGGPLMGSLSSDPNSPQWYQEGIVSWGVGCGVVSKPAVYTRVAKYMTWIQDNLKP